MKNIYRFRVYIRYAEGFSNCINIYARKKNALKYAEKRQENEENGARFYVTDEYGREVE